jgi:hypothetical protein
MRFYLLGLALLPALALADSKAPATPSPISELTSRLEGITSKSTRPQLDVPKFALSDNVTFEQPANADEALTGFPETSVADTNKTIVATAADPDTAWISTHLGEHFAACGKAGCAKEAPDSWLRATALFEKSNGTWQPVAWAITPAIPGTSQQEALDQNINPDAISRNTAGADEVAKLFEGSIGDPKKFAATFSDRKEVVMFGSELAERYVGKQAKSQVTAWNFSFTVRDGVRAGTSKSGNVAWVAANVDAKPVKSPKAKALPFRAFALYEKTGADWKLVSLQFSTSV